jgi:hypothetical protein
MNLGTLEIGNWFDVRKGGKKYDIACRQGKKSVMSVLVCFLLVPTETLGGKK